MAGTLAEAEAHVEDEAQTDFPPIADHGLIGDLRTCALVGKDATIDWFCAPRFDSPSVFGSLLDPDAGAWTIEVVDGATRTHQFYFPDSNILVTRFLTEQGVAEVHDFMPLLKAHDDRPPPARRTPGGRPCAARSPCARLIRARPTTGARRPRTEARRRRPAHRPATASGWA